MKSLCFCVYLSFYTVLFYVFQSEDVRSWYGERISPNWRTYVFRMEDIEFKLYAKKKIKPLPQFVVGFL